jgi:hypothetical protein
VVEVGVFFFCLYRFVEKVKRKPCADAFVVCSIFVMVSKTSFDEILEIISGHERAIVA